jgi:hypothetical protein
MGYRGNLVTEGIAERLEILRLVMEKRPNCLSDNNLKWFLRLSKQYSKYKRFSPAQFKTLVDITDYTLKKANIEKNF